MHTIDSVHTHALLFPWRESYNIHTYYVYRECHNNYVCTSACHQGFLSPASQFPFASWEQHFLPSVLCMYIHTVSNSATLQLIIIICSAPFYRTFLFIIHYIIFYGLIWMKLYTLGLLTLLSMWCLIVRYPNRATPNLAQYILYYRHYLPAIV